MSWRASTSSVLLATLRCWTEDSAKEVESQILENLELVTELDLGKSEPGADGVVALVKALQIRAFPRLEIMDLSFNPIGDKGVRELAKAIIKGNLSNLRVLEIRSVHMGPAGGRALAKALESGGLSCLHTLRLDSNDIEDLGLVALAEALESGHVPSLRLLGIGQSDLLKLMGGGDNGLEGFHIAGAQALGKALQSGKLAQFEALHLDGMDGEEGVMAVMSGLEAGRVGAFKSLHLSSYDVGVEGVRAIAHVLTSQRFSALTSLGLPFGICLRDESLRVLSEAFKSQNMNKLHTLEFSNVSMTEQGLLEMAALLEAGHLPSLQKLICTGACNTLASSQALVRAYMKNPFLVVKILVDWPTEQIRNNAEGLRKRNIRSVGSLKVLKDEPLVAGYHGKVFVCGQPKVGKTSLRKSLCSLTRWEALAASVRKRDSVSDDVGSRMDVSIVSHKKLNLGLWDLQGQAEYDLIHGGFLSHLAYGNCQTTMFLLVCSANYTGEENKSLAKRELDYWMRYISSMSARGVQDCKPLVFVVLNSFQGDHSCHNHGEWTSIISMINTNFLDFFNVHPYPFILSALHRKDVKHLKTRLLETASNLLQGTRIPKICRKIHERVGMWSTSGSRYPILRWGSYLRTIGGALDSIKVRAATEYLHEAGHLMYFRAGSLRGEDLAGESLVILHPDWFWKQMLQHILLPEPSNIISDSSLKHSMCADGSIFLPAFRAHIRRNLEIDAAQANEVIAVLTSLDLVYKISEDCVFVPSRLETDDVPVYWSLATPGHWVMGFSLAMAETESATMLPIAVFRQLQVRLSRHPEFGHRLNDNHYIAGRNMISFRSKGMAVAVQYSPDPTNRLDIIVRPLLVANEYEDYREIQVNIAQKILGIVVNITDGCSPTDSIVHISERLCPGIDFMIQVMKPWSTEEGLKPVELRDVNMSVDEVKEWIRRSASEPSHWTVEGEHVAGNQQLVRRDLESIKRTTFDPSKSLVEGEDVSSNQQLVRRDLESIKGTTYDPSKALVEGEDVSSNQQLVRRDLESIKGTTYDPSKTLVEGEDVSSNQQLVRRDLESMKKTTYDPSKALLEGEDVSSNQQLVRRVLESMKKTTYDPSKALLEGEDVSSNQQLVRRDLESMKKTTYDPSKALLEGEDVSSNQQLVRRDLESMKKTTYDPSKALLEGEDVSSNQQLVRRVLESMKKTTYDPSKALLEGEDVSSNQQLVRRDLESMKKTTIDPSKVLVEGEDVSSNQQLVRRDLESIKKTTYDPNKALIDPIARVLNIAR
ncbi:hypothetical protein Mapa_009658 [Marchantia paleacea]|nr:hypothetical protein Mapa_009658 [Marchantia paleacea]